MPKVTEAKRSLEDARDTKSRARLLDLPGAAEYTGVSYWTVRDWVQAGILPAVKLPCSQGRRKGGAVVRRAGDLPARRILIDRADLDALIERSKETTDPV